MPSNIALTSSIITNSSFVGIKNILTEIKNGSQKYIKTNPAVSEMAKINAQMINLSKDMGLSAPPPGVKALAEAGYKESDLI